MSDHELLLANKELLERLLSLLRIGVGLGVLILIGVIAEIVIKLRTRNQQGHLLQNQTELLKNQAEFNDSARGTLTLVRGWVESARAASSETKEAAKKLNSGPTREELVQKIEEVPKLVVEKIKTDPVVGPKLGDSK